MSFPPLPIRLPAQPKTAKRCLTAILLAAAATTAQAQTCGARLPQVDFAREDLQRAAMEGDLPTAQDFADRARREFDHLAGLATRCGCTAAASPLQDAAAQVHQAQSAESRQELRKIIAVTKGIFETALVQLRECAKR